MRTLLAGLALTGAAVLLAAAAFLLLREGRSPAAEAEPAARVTEPAPGGASPAIRELRARADDPGRAAFALDPVEGEAQDAPGEPPEPFPWRLRDPPQVDGPLIESHYADGQPEFLGRQVRTADGEWVRDGPWTAWYENGQVCEHGAYLDGAEHGPWEWYYEDGTPMAAGSWEAGKRVGPWSFWHESGALGSVGSYVDGVGSGTWTLYHESGWKWAEGPWVNGEPNGHWNVWNEDGSLDPEGTGTYVDGVKVD
jgi:antitoxin component YwqK of YwqJK toxin-antitoxin module